MPHLFLDQDLLTPCFHADMIRALAKAGADINYTGLCREQKRPALHAAAETCPSDVVKTLLDMQPDLNARWDGETALHVAARREKQNKSVLEALLRAGCNTWARTTPEGLTARELAESAGNSKLAVVLVAAEAKAETDRCHLRLLTGSPMAHCCVLRACQQAQASAAPWHR